MLWLRSYINSLATSLNSNETALTFLISLILAYPLALVHRYLLFAKSPTLQHVFFTLGGMFLIYLNFGTDVIHGIINTVVVYAVLQFSRGNKIGLGICFVFNLVYLIVAYYYTATSSYDIKWSTPHCVLTLRLTGLAFDVYDGTKKEEKLSSEQKEAALKKIPSILEVFGNVYCIGGVMVGPQFPMRRYQDFVAGAFADKVTGGLPQCVVPGLKRFALGIFYIIVYQISGVFFTDDYMITDAYAALPFWQRVLYIMIWAKFTLYKYISCWLIAEGCCIVLGLSHNGKDVNGNDLWNGCANVKLRQYELACSGKETIGAFNINTNLWMSRYIYKRLKFLGNRSISQCAALVYLAVWHGLHSGYYNNFFLEFLIMKFEKELTFLVEKVPLLKNIANNPSLKIPVFILCRIYQLFLLGYPVMSFCLLSFDRWGKVYSSVYWCGHIFYFSWALIFPFIYKLLVPKRKKENSSDPGVEKKEN